MRQAEFERFAFTLGGAEVIAADVIARDAFIPTRRMENVTVIEEEEVPPPPTFSEEELEAAKTQAYQNGFHEGEQKGLAHAESEIAKIEQAALEQIPELQKQIAELFTTYRQFATEQQQAAPQLALALAKKICGDLPPEHLLEQVVHHATECVDTMLGAPEIHVYVHPDLSDKIEERLAAHFADSHEPGDVLIHADEALPLSDCRVEWRTGGMAYQHGSVMAQLEELVAGLSHSAAQPSETMPLEVSEPEPELDDAISEALAQQLEKDDIPPIPEDPQPPTEEPDNEQ